MKQHKPPNKAAQKLSLAQQSQAEPRVGLGEEALQCPTARQALSSLQPCSLPIPAHPDMRMSHCSIV